MAGPSREIIAATRKEVGIDDDKFPSSVAIIMDGNGRWAKRQGMMRPLGHIEGAKRAREIIEEATNLGLSSLTLYSFSQQNWKRPQEEIEMLMKLYAEYLEIERQTVMENNIRLRHIGDRSGLPDMVLQELDKTVSASASNTGMFFCLALNYGSREEIVSATRKIARQVSEGRLSVDDIDQKLFASCLDTNGVPDPDLLIRTAGEMRISNYLLYQISYAEFYVTDTLWPDFHRQQLHEAIREYASRDRRFGGLNK